MSRRFCLARRAASLLAAVLLCGAAPSAWSAAPPQLRLYDVQVPLPGTTEADRAAGFREALGLLAVRVSGQSAAAASPTIAAADPARYVQRYSTSAEGVLTVGFERGAVARLLEQAGLPFWPDERPVTRIEAPGADQGEALRLAERRGLPIEWGDHGGPERAAGTSALLQGTPAGGAYDWSFTHAGQTARTRGSLAQGIDLAADTLAARYAPGSTRTESSFPLRVDGIADLGAYAAALGYLESLSLVSNVAVEGLDGTVLRLRVTARGDRELLARVAALDGKLLAAEGEAAGSGADLRYVP